MDLTVWSPPKNKSSFQNSLSVRWSFFSIQGQNYIFSIWHLMLIVTIAGLFWIIDLPHVNCNFPSFDQDFSLHCWLKIIGTYGGDSNPLLSLNSFIFTETYVFSYGGYNSEKNFCKNRIFILIAPISSFVFNFFRIFFFCGGGAKYV